MNEVVPALTRRDLLSGVLVAAGLHPTSAMAAQPAAPGSSGLAPQGPGETDASYWSRVKAQFLVRDDLIYLNAGTCGLQVRETAAVEAAIRAEMALDFNRYFVQRLIDRRFREVVGRVASFVGADIDDVAFTSGATEAINYVASGLDLGTGDEVVTTTHDHQAGVYPWLMLAKRRGIRVVQIPWDVPTRSSAAILDRFMGALTPRTRVLSFCHVQYTDGTVLPAAEICAQARARGIFTLVDGAQSVGMLDFAIRDLGCDTYATSLHKWLGAPYGTGLLWVRPEWRDRLWPTVVESYDGWDAADRYGAVTGRPGLDFVDAWPKAMIKYSTNLHYYGSVFWAVDPAVAFQLSVGKARIEGRVRALAGELKARLSRVRGVDVLTPSAPGLSAGLVAFRVAGADMRALARAISREDGLVIRSVIHEGVGFAAARACLHVWNTEDDIERLVKAVERRASA